MSGTIATEGVKREMSGGFTGVEGVVREIFGGGGCSFLELLETLPTFESTFMDSLNNNFVKYDEKSIVLFSNEGSSQDYTYLLFPNGILVTLKATAYATSDAIEIVRLTENKTLSGTITLFINVSTKKITRLRGGRIRVYWLPA